MRRTIATFIHDGGTYRVIHDDSKSVNPYRVYRNWYELTNHGCMKRTKQIARYDHIADCMYLLYDISNKGGSYAH